MLFTFRRMTPGSRTEVRSGRGQVGIPIPGSGLAVHIYHLEEVSALATSVVLDGAGPTGALIGTTDTPSITIIGTTLGATHFTTAIISTAAAQVVAASMPVVAELLAGTSPEIVLPRETLAVAASFRTVPAPPSGLSMATPEPLEVTP